MVIVELDVLVDSETDAETLEELDGDVGTTGTLEIVVVVVEVEMVGTELIVTLVEVLLEVVGVLTDELLEMEVDVKVNEGLDDVLRELDTGDELGDVPIIDDELETGIVVEVLGVAEIDRVLLVELVVVLVETLTELR